MIEKGGLGLDGARRRRYVSARWGVSSDAKAQPSEEVSGRGMQVEYHKVLEEGVVGLDGARRRRYVSAPTGGCRLTGRVAAGAAQGRS